MKVEIRLALRDWDYVTPLALGDVADERIALKVDRVGTLPDNLATDPDYVETHRLAQKKWQENNPDYWRTYRKKHPKPPHAASDPQDAKIDAIRTYLNDSSNIYDLVPISPDGVKIDAIRVIIIPVSRR